MPDTKENTAAATTRSTDAKQAEANYPRKYWWVILVIVPIAIALIQARPWQRAAGSSGGSSFTARDISIIVQEAERSGAPLTEELVNELKQAAERSRDGQHAAAVASIEKVRSSSSQAAALPSLLVNLGDEYRLSGKESEARRTYQAVLQADPANERVLAGLSRLPDAPLEGLQLVNFTSQHENVWGDTVASNLVDGNPSSAWVSRDAQFPQTFIFALPAQASISEVSFNNPAFGSPDRAAKDVEISVSSQSATSGFVVAAKGTLAQNDIGQGVRLESAPVGRWIKVRVLTNYGNKERTSLGDVAVSGKLRPN